MTEDITAVDFVNTTARDSSVNSSDTTYLIQKLDHWSYIIYMASVVLVLGAFFMNGMVLTALWVRKSISPKCSFLIQGIVISDILLSLVIGTQILPYILLVFGCDPVLSFYCYGGVTLIAGSFLAMVQSYTGLAIALDRLVSVLSPLTYHVSEYSMVLKSLTLGGIWVTLLTIYVGFTVFDLLAYSETDHRHICLILMEMYGKDLVSITATLFACCIFATQCLYLGTLGVVLKHRVRRRRLTDATNKLQRSKASLALTFFLMQSVYLLCYLPIVIQYAYSTNDLWRERLPGFDINAYAITSLVYQCNTIIDPIIFTWRIRSVRDYVGSFIWQKDPRGSEDKGPERHLF